MLDAAATGHRPSTRRRITTGAVSGPRWLGSGTASVGTVLTRGRHLDAPRVLADRRPALRRRSGQGRHRGDDAETRGGVDDSEGPVSRPRLIDALWVSQLAYRGPGPARSRSSSPLADDGFGRPGALLHADRSSPPRPPTAIAMRRLSPAQVALADAVSRSTSAYARSTAPAAPCGSSRAERLRASCFTAASTSPEQHDWLGLDHRRRCRLDRTPAAGAPARPPATGPGSGGASDDDPAPTIAHRPGRAGDRAGPIDHGDGTRHLHHLAHRRRRPWSSRPSLSSRRGNAGGDGGDSRHHCGAGLGPAGQWPTSIALRTRLAVGSRPGKFAPATSLDGAD